MLVIYSKTENEMKKEQNCHTLLDKASEAKSPGSSESDVFQYNNSTCAVDLIDEDKSGNENGNENENENEDSLAERLNLMYLYILLPIAVFLVSSFTLYFVAINLLKLGEAIAMIVNYFLTQ